MKSLFLTLMACCISAGAPSHADEFSIPIPEGWTLASYVSPIYQSGRVAFVIHQEDWAESNRVVQRQADASQSRTDFPGKVWSVKYAPDGKSLLAQYSVDDGSNHGGSRVALVRLDGSIEWSRSDVLRSYQFSANGSHLVAWQASELVRKGSKLELFSFGGESQVVVDTGQKFHAALLLDDGKRVVVGVSKSIRCMRVESGEPRELWRIDLTESDEEIVRFADLGNQRFEVRQSMGHFMVVTHDGAIEYRHDPVRLGEEDPNLSVRDYRQYNPYRDYSKDSELILFEHSGRTLQLDLEAGTLAPRKLGTSVPKGFHLRPYPQGGAIILRGKREIRIRPIAH